MEPYETLDTVPSFCHLAVLFMESSYPCEVNNLNNPIERYIMKIMSFRKG